MNNDVKVWQILTSIGLDIIISVLMILSSNVICKMVFNANINGKEFYMLCIGVCLVCLIIFMINSIFVLREGTYQPIRDIMLACVMYNMVQMGTRAIVYVDTFSIALTIMILFSFCLLVRSKKVRYYGLAVYTIMIYIFHTIYLTRGINLIPKEIMLWKTALMVANNYDIVWFKPEYICLILNVILGVLIIKTDCRNQLDYSYKVGRLKFTFRGFSITMCLSFVVGFLYSLNRGVFSIWHWRYNAPDNGIIVTLILLLLAGDGYKPAGYGIKYYERNYSEEYNISDSLNKEIQPSVTNPNVLMVCLEAFDDGFNDKYKDFVRFDKNPLEFWDSLKTKPNTVSGYVVPNIAGGLTANSEFELITNMNLKGCFQDSTVIFDMVMNSPIKSNADFFNNKGYNSVYMHPFYSVGYSRSSRIPELGFRKSYFIENMINGKWEECMKNINSDEKQPYVESLHFNGDTLNAHNFNIDSYRGFPSDKYDFKRVIDVLNDSEKPVYLFNMTVQNHGDWSIERDMTKGVEDFSIRCVNENFTDEVISELESFGSSMYETDRAIQELYNNIMKLDEPTIVCMVGDHNAGLVKLMSTNEFKEWFKVDGNDILYKRVPYCIFANYDISEDAINNMGNKEMFSTSFLPVKFMDFGNIDYSQDKTLTLTKQISQQVDVMSFDLDMIKYKDGEEINIDKDNIQNLNTYCGLLYYRTYDCDYNRNYNGT